MNFLVKFLVIISSFGAFSDSVYAAETCQMLFAQDQVLAQSPAFPQDPETLSRVKEDVKNSQVASDFFMKKLQQESNTLKAKYKNRVLELDFLCIGAGPQCAASSLVLGGVNLRSLVLEKTDLVAKTFAEKDFFINSLELDNLTMHQFPNGVGGLAEHTSQKYAMSSQLAAHIQMQQYASNVPVLLNTMMTNIAVLKRNGKVLLEITTDQGIVIRTSHLMLGTGLGEVGTKVRDAAYQAAFQLNYQNHLKHPDTLQPIMSTDTFLSALKKAKANGKVIRMPKRILIIGDGDGSRISLEGMASPHVKLPKDFHITWNGNNFKTAKEYLASRKDDRYVHLVIPFYERGQINGIPGHVQSWEIRPDSSMRITAADKETNQTLDGVGDMIIDATGYQNTLPHYFEKIGASEKLADVTGPLPELNLETTILGRQVVTKEGQVLPIFVVGPAAGSLATPEELASSIIKNPIAIFNTAPRTSMLTSQLTGTPPALSVRGVREKRPGVVPAKQFIKEAKKHRKQQINRPLSFHFGEKPLLGSSGYFWQTAV